MLRINNQLPIAGWIASLENSIFLISSLPQCLE